jgi:hypothetical protein
MNAPATDPDAAVAYFGATTHGEAHGTLAPQTSQAKVHPPTAPAWWDLAEPAADRPGAMWEDG